MANMFHDMVQREVNAGNEFIANLREQFDLSAAQAEHVFAVYRRCKAIKLARGIGRWQLKHGGLWERDAIDVALTMPTK